MAGTFLKNINGQNYAIQYVAAKKDKNKAAMDNAVLGGALTGLEAGIGIAGAAGDAAQYGDTSYYDAMLKANNPDRFNGNYYSNTDVLSTFGTGLQHFDVDKKDLNPTFGQSALKVGSGALQGIEAGATIGGVPGAIIGGVVGGGAVLVGDLYGRHGNELQAGSLNYQQNLQDKQFALARQSAADQAHANQFGDMYAQRKAEGGRIEKKQQSISDFATQIMKRTSRSSGQSSPRIIKEYCNGGIRIKIK